MTKEQIYNIFCDIAEDMDVKPEELIIALKCQNDARFDNSLAEMPEETAKYVKNARDDKIRTRESRRKAESEKLLDEDIKVFRRVFPNVKAEDIPENVWADAEKGIPLPYAYAFHVMSEESYNYYADMVNGKNSEGAIPPVEGTDGSGEFSADEVEGMSTAAVKKNFPAILRSITKWKI